MHLTDRDREKINKKINKIKSSVYIHAVVHHIVKNLLNGCGNWSATVGLELFRC